MKLSLILPAYNEAAAIEGVVKRFSDFFVSRNIAHEILVVSDGSSDATAEIVKNVSRVNPFVRLIELTTNQGYGGALRSGFSASSGDFIFFTDSDGQFAPEDLEHSLPFLDERTIVLGYRKNRTEGTIRRLNAWLWGQCIRGIFGIRVRDLDCAWKLFPRTLLDDVTFVSRGAFISAELLYYARKKKLAFHELPVAHFPRRAGTSTGANVRVILRAFRELVFFLKHHDHP